MVCRGDKFVYKEFGCTLLIEITVSGQRGFNKIVILNPEQGILCRSFSIVNGLNPGVSVVRVA